jgi:hypothetical protein
VGVVPARPADERSVRAPVNDVIYL